MNDIFDDEEGITPSRVECLGMHFDSENDRRDYFKKILYEKLKDKKFRDQPGFPLGSDDTIVNLSDPPYYTACPNPFVMDFLKVYGKPYDQELTYQKEPFATDISEGKNESIYGAHSYHTKVPHKAIMRFILHYTKPGDIIFDGFCGTGMTGVAAQRCGDRAEIESLGYRVDNDGIIFSEQNDLGKKYWKPISKLGARVALLNDLSPIATFISYNYNSPLNQVKFKSESTNLLNKVEKDLGWTYWTLHNPTLEQLNRISSNLHEENAKILLSKELNVGKINYTVWSDVLSCPNCGDHFVYWDGAVTLSTATVLEEFPCPHCGVSQKKSKFEKYFETIYDQYIKKNIKKVRQVPVLINYSIGKKRYQKKPDLIDLAIVNLVESLPNHSWVPTEPIGKGDKTSDPLNIGIGNLHQFYSSRNLLILSRLYAEINSSKLDDRMKNYLVVWFTSSQSRLHRMNRYAAQHVRHVGPLANTLYVSSTPTEISPFYFIDTKIKDNTLNLVNKSQFLVSTSDASIPLAPANSVDYIFLDPPFGANIMYSELNQLLEGWLKLFTNNVSEAIQNKTQGKGIDEYRILMVNCFKEAYRILKPGRWMTVEFSNTQSSVWNGIQSALQEAGFVVSSVEALNKGRGGLHSIIGKTAVKQDLVISAYKPDGLLEEKFNNGIVGVESLWDFIGSHMTHLPVVKLKDGAIQYISERDPRILFDRMVAWFVCHNQPIPISSIEFQSLLGQKFPERDGMYFLPDQVIEYDKKRLQTARAPQIELFVSDERSAIDWLTDFLKKKPSTYQELHPEFISQLGVGWRKHEAKPELSKLLEDNFIQYNGGDNVPSQVHSYLSSNFRDLRGLDKNNPQLMSKAKDRWYVPDPNKSQDLEKKREKFLLKEFDSYKLSIARKIKEFRLEVVRAGFKDAWTRKDYQTILFVAQKIPEEALQEDEKLLLWYDQALTRSEMN